VHFGSKEEINDPSLGPLEVYGRAKLAMLMLAKYGLATKALAGTGDTVFSTAVHPGAVNTEMQQQWKRAYPGLFGQIVSATMLAIGRDIEQGSYSALYALTAPEIEEKNMNGQYFADVASPSKESSQGQDHLLGAALWDLSHRLVEEKVGRDAMVDWTAEP
jgi:NAD(P)-dependent dehydrogenase (short-subunit alcohol dehydrogenase family)